jgi:hypothetical protein
MKNNAHTQVNCDKIRVVTQGPKENSALFLMLLTDAMTKYTNVDLNSMAGTLFLHVQFKGSQPQTFEKS